MDKKFDKYMIVALIIFFMTTVIMPLFLVVMFIFMWFIKNV